MAVLWLARQQNLLGYRKADGSQPERRAGGFVVQRIGGPTLPQPNILAGPGSGPAWVAETVLPVLDALGLARDGQWTADAETVLWRGMPAAWDLRFDTDLRFLTAVEAAVATVPGAVRGKIDRLLCISAADVETGVAQSKRTHEELRIRFGRPSAALPFTEEQVRRGLPRQRENDLDWVFFRHWRLGRGWLDEAAKARAMEIFHDQLAVAMRKAVIARLYPDGFVWE